MKSKTLASAVRVLSLLLLVSGTCALAEEHRPIHLTGLLNDYSPLDPTIKGSPYEMHGQWSMEVNAERGTADFLSGYDDVRLWNDDNWCPSIRRRAVQALTRTTSR